MNADVIYEMIFTIKNVRFKFKVNFLQKGLISSI